MLNPDVITAVRERTDIVALIGESTRLVRKGATWRGCCPFHKEKTPSFHVNPERGRYVCFGCKETGSAIDFVMKTDGLDFVEAVRALAERLNIEVEETRSPQERQEAAAAKNQRDAVYRANEIAAQWFEASMWAGPLPDGVLQEWGPELRTMQRQIGGGNAWAELVKRGLVPRHDVPTIVTTLRAFRVGYAPPFWDLLARHLVQMGISPVVAEQAGLVAPRQSGGGYYDRFRNRLMFAVVDVQSRVVGFSGRTLPVPPGGDAAACKEAAKYLNTGESHIYTKGDNLFGLYQGKAAIRRADEAILVEGNFDVVSLHARGIDNVVAPLGTAFTAEQAALLKRFGTKVLVAFDGDAAGVKATTAARDACAGAALSARVVSLPNGTDPDVLVREKGIAAWQRLVGSAVGIVEWLIDQALDPATFGRASLQEQLDRVRAVADLLGRENDLDMRRMASGYADKAAAKLGLTSSSSVTIGQLRSMLTAKVRTGDNAATAPACAPLSADHAIQEAILGALIDQPSLLDDAALMQDVEHVMSDDCALVVAALERHGTGHELLAELPASVHAFVAGRIVAPEHDLESALMVVHGNVGKLIALQRQSQHDDLLAKLDAASADGDDDKVSRILNELDALNRRR
jgi:DNA primase